MTRGWCPGVYEPMPSGDGLLVRVKPFGGRLSDAQLRALAEAAARHGNGVVELTSRGNLQIRGLSAGTVPGFAAAMVAAGLADPDPARERRRNVITAPPCDDALVAAVEAVLADIPGLAAKFCVGFGWNDADIVIGVDDTEAAPEKVRRLALAANGQRLRTAPRATPKRLGPYFAALPFGQTDAAALAGLAERVDSVRTTPWRAFHLNAPVSAAGFITDPADPRLALAACAGSPACASATVPTRADAAFLAAQGIIGVHVSGCAKGCAHPAATRTLVGRAGRYDLVRQGRAGDAPDRTGLTITEAAALLA